MRAFALLLCLLPSLALAATSNVVTTARSSVALISARNAPEHGALTLALQFHLAPGWHIYWQNPGDAGLPPAVTLQAPAIAGLLSYPAPTLLLQPPVASYVLTGDVLLPFTAQNVAGNAVQADANWLVCRDICVPEHAHFVLKLSGGASAEAGLFGAAKIVASPFPATLTPDGILVLTGPTAASIAAAHFFPLQNGAVINREPQVLSYTPTGIALKLPTTGNFRNTSPLPGILTLTDRSGVQESLAVTPVPGGDAAAAGTPIEIFVGLAFLGGLLLNLMPCVFPILAMKALALIRLGGQQQREIRKESFAYTAGVLTAMVALAALLLGLRAAGIQAGWGFQFQSPVFVACIAYLVFVSGLSLAGVFEVTAGTNFAARLAQKHSFFTGLLAVLLASPCTAPFMGGAVAAALAAPPLPALGIFVALGLGLASPFLLLAVIPGFGKMLPRPGAWMRHLQRALSLPMFATAIWLAWVLQLQAGLWGVCLLGVGAVALYAAVTQRRRRPAALVAFLVLPILPTTAATPSLTLPNARPFSEAALAAAKSAQTPVLIDITAAWCVTCLVNEHGTLAAPKIQAFLAAHHVELLVGDWTSRSQSISQFLAENHRDGVPLYVYIPASGAPRILPQILTPAIVEAAIK